MEFIIIAPWRPKKSLLSDTMDNYLSRFPTKPIFIHPEKNLKKEDLSLFYETQIASFVKKGGLSLFICLDEKGKERTSCEFSNWIEEQRDVKRLIFCFGNEEGLPPRQIFKEAKNIAPLSLSKMTLPHEFALLFLVEQLYRHLCQKNNHPYHKGHVSSFMTNSTS